MTSIGGPARLHAGVADKDGKYLQVAWDPASNAVGETTWSAKAAGTRSRQYAWAYDPGRNRIRQFLDGVQRSYTIGDFGEVTVSGTDVLTYDHFCNLKTWTVGLSTTSFDWDYEGNLLKIDYPGTANDDTHEYDGNGLRMRSKLSGAADWTNFVTDEVTGNLIAEYTLVSSTFTLQQVNTWGVGLLWTRRGSTDRYFHFDGEGGTRALTDDSQATTDTYTYNRFGVLESSTGSSVNPFRWMGAVGTYDDGARGSVQGLLIAWSPALGRSLAQGGPTYLRRKHGCSFWERLRMRCSSAQLAFCVAMCARRGGTFLFCHRIPFTCESLCFCVGGVNWTPDDPCAAAIRRAQSMCSRNVPFRDCMSCVATWCTTFAHAVDWPCAGACTAILGLWCRSG